MNFLEGATVHDPLEYVKQVCFESSAYYPIYYYISASHLNLVDVIKELDKTITTNPAKDRLIGALQETAPTCDSSSKKGNPNSKTRDKMVDQIKAATFTLPKDAAGLKLFLKAVRTMPKSDLNLAIVNPLKTIFKITMVKVDLG
ncbi:MAG: hypothetical protein IPK04_15660 [Bdellovibrionales bacterium]|nr:hypothetical protein [Bdellovibrionales bacterium]